MDSTIDGLRAASDKETEGLRSAVNKIQTHRQNTQSIHKMHLALLILYLNILDIFS